MPALIVLAVLCIGVMESEAQFDVMPISSRCHAMGGTGVAVRDFGAGNVNPATLGWLRRWSVMLDYRQMMLVKGMGYKSLALGIPTGKWGAAALYYSHFGDLVYNEQTLTAGYGMRVASGVSVGVTVAYLHAGTNDGHYDRFNTVTGSVGVQYSPNERLVFGAAVYNPYFVRRDGEYRIPVQLNIGASYRPLDSFILTLELEKNIYDKMRVRFGAEYCIWDHLLVDAGIATGPMVYSLGLGYIHSHIRAGVAVSVHQRVGVTPGVTVGYVF